MLTEPRAAAWVTSRCTVLMYKMKKFCFDKRRPEMRVYTTSKCTNNWHVRVTPTNTVSRGELFYFPSRSQPGFSVDRMSVMFYSVPCPWAKQESEQKETQVRRLHFAREREHKKKKEKMKDEMFGWDAMLLLFSPWAMMHWHCLNKVFS